MAKKSKIARNEQRKLVVERYAEKRLELKKTLVDENAFGILIAHYGIEDEEYALERDAFVERFSEFRSAVLDFVATLPVSSHALALDLGHALYVEFADGEQNEDPLAWAKAARALLTGRSFESAAIVAHGAAHLHAGVARQLVLQLELEHEVADAALADQEALSAAADLAQDAAVVDAPARVAQLAPARERRAVEQRQLARRGRGARQRRTQQQEREAQAHAISARCTTPETSVSRKSRPCER